MIRSSVWDSRCHQTRVRTVAVGALGDPREAAWALARSRGKQLIAVDQHLAELYEAEQNRVDDGEYVGLFVKNGRSTRPTTSECP